MPYFEIIPGHRALVVMYTYAISKCDFMLSYYSVDVTQAQSPPHLPRKDKHCTKPCKVYHNIARNTTKNKI